MNGYVNREEFIQEIILREQIRELATGAYNKRRSKKDARLLEERKLRKLIKKLLSEAAQEAAPHENTGINVLADLLKTIIPQIESEYKLLTTDPQQRESFRAHVVNAAQNTLAATKAVDKSAEEAGMDMALPMQEADEEELDINLDVKTGGEEGDEKFIDIDDTPDPEEEEEEEDTFGLEGEDETGRNFAARAFEKIEKQILDAYELLSNEEDKQLFYDYLITNLKLYFDKFEDELSSSLPEPTTDEYEEEAAEAEEEAELGGDEELGGEELEGEEELEL
jgi:hypothetical protein